MTTGRINQVTALAARTSKRCASTSSRVRSPSDSCSRPTRSTRRLPSATHRLLAREDLAAARCLPSVRSPRRCGCAPDRGVHALVVRMPPFVQPNRARLFCLVGCGLGPCRPRFHSRGRRQLSTATARRMLVCRRVPILARLSQ